MIQQDKIEHWAFGFVLTLFALIDPVFIFLGLAFAFCKELYDHFYGRGWKNVDIVSTCIGAICGLGFLVLTI